MQTHKLINNIKTTYKVIHRQIPIIKTETIQICSWLVVGETRAHGCHELPGRSDWQQLTRTERAFPLQCLWSSDGREQGIPRQLPLVLSQ